MNNLLFQKRNLIIPTTSVLTENRTSPFNANNKRGHSSNSRKQSKSQNKATPIVSDKKRGASVNEQQQNSEVTQMTVEYNPYIRLYDSKVATYDLDCVGVETP